MPNRAELLKQKFETSVGLPLVEVLPEEWIQQVLEEAGVGQRESIYTPMVTLWAWLSQILDPDKSLQNTVNRIVSWLVEAGLKVPSRDTGAYRTYPTIVETINLPCQKFCETAQNRISGIGS
jgi:hypothetical protein